MHDNDNFCFVLFVVFSLENILPFVKKKEGMVVEVEVKFLYSVSSDALLCELYFIYLMVHLREYTINE